MVNMMTLDLLIGRECYHSNMPYIFIYSLISFIQCVLQIQLIGCEITQETLVKTSQKNQIKLNQKDFGNSQIDSRDTYGMWINTHSEKYYLK